MEYMLVRWLVAGCFTQIIKMHQVTKLWVLNIGILIYISLSSLIQKVLLQLYD